MESAVANPLARLLRLFPFCLALFLAACGGGGGEAALEPPRLVSIQITPPVTSKAIGLTQQYTAIGTYSSGPNQDITGMVTWRSGNAGQASISANGLATAVAVGAPAITASLGTIQSNTATFTVTSAALLSIQVTPATTSRAIGLTQQYTAIGTYTDGSTPDISANVVWSSSSPAVAAIAAGGLATAASVGNSTVSASLSGVVSNNVDFAATAAALVSIQVTPASVSRAVGLTQQYTATGTYTDGSTPDITASVSWNSGDPSKASISAGGLATAVAAGTSPVTATLGGITSNTASLQVTPAALVSIQVTPATASRYVGQTQQFTATGTYTDGTTPDMSGSVSWNSSDTAKATISTGGLATAVATGTTTITATSGAVVSNGATLTLTTPPPFLPTGNLVTARMVRTATLLADGKVLAAGGTNTSGSALASSELYDPATGTWSATGSMGVPRSQHTLTRLADGRVLVTGGANGAVLGSCEIYDPATGTWTATGSLNTPRFYHSATLLADGRVLVTGGIDSGSLTASGLVSSEVFDPATGTWTATGDMGTGTTHHAAVLLPNGKVLVAGGRLQPFQSGGDQSRTELYDPATGTWAATGTMGTARRQHSANLLANGSVLVAGGSSSASAEIYDPATALWTATGSMAQAREAHTATVLADGRVLVTSGTNGELFDPATGTWASAGTMNATRTTHSAVLLVNGKVLVLGGYNGSAVLSSSELFTP